MAWVYNITNSNAPTDAAEIVAIAVVMTALALLVATLRIYVRWGILNVFGIGMQQAQNSSAVVYPARSIQRFG